MPEAALRTGPADRLRTRGRGVVTWVAARRLVLAVGLLAALPVVVALVRALAWQWFPVSSDQAIIATRAFDVLSDRSPLVGQYSQLSLMSGHATFSPGPLLYWLLALPARLGPDAMVVVIGLVNIAAVMGTVALARRRGGTGLMFATAIGIAVMCHSLGTERLHDIWNPYVAVLPLLLLIFACWSIACGEHRLLPLAVLTASFVAQAQIVFVFPTLGLLLVAIGGLAAGRRRPDRRLAGLRRSVVAAVIVALVCWSAPLYDEVIHRPGNLERIVQAGTAKRHAAGSATGWRAVVRTVGFPPAWLRGPADTTGQEVLRSGSMPRFARISTAAMLAALAAITVIGVRRRRIDVAGVGALGLVLCAAIGVAAGTTPVDHGLLLTLAYTLWWTAPVSMYVFLAVAWGTVTLLRDTGPVRALGARLRDAGPRTGTLAGLAALVAAGAYAAATQNPDELRPLYEPARAFGSRVGDALPSDSHVRVDATSTASGVDLQAALVCALRQRGRDVDGGNFLAIGLGRAYANDPPYDHLVNIGDAEPPSPGELVLVRRVVDARGEGRHVFTVGLTGPSSG
jgi:hypothetical protein